MKNNELHEHLSELGSAHARTPLFEQRLRRAVLNSNIHKQSFGKRFRSTFTNMRFSFMGQHKKLIGLSTFGLVAVMLLSVATYSVRFSPKAAAEQEVDRGISLLSAQTPTDLAKLQAKFGGDPAAALKEARAAKDLTVISKDEFLAESKAAPGIFATSVNDGNGNVGVPNSGGMTFMSTKSPDGGTMAMGSVSATATTGGAIRADSSGPVSVGATADGTPTFTTNTPASGSISGPGTQVTSVGPDGSTKVTGSASTSAEAGTTTLTSTSAPLPANVKPGTATAIGPVPDSVISATNGAVTLSNGPMTYLRYTDSKGHVVVLSLDKNGVPIFKTVFMTKSEAAQLSH